MLGENRGVFRHGSAWLALEVAALVAAAVAVALLHLGPLKIAVVMGGVFAIVALLDLAVIRSRVRRRPEPDSPPTQRPVPARPSADRLWLEGVRPTRQTAPAPAPRARSTTAPPPRVPSVPPPHRERIVASGRGPLPAADGNGAGWNVWDLQSRARALAGRNPLQDEEWAFLLLYLREFASPDGILPRDFDRLVRTSFAQLVGRR
jgi:hypothetical protein